MDDDDERLSSAIIYHRVLSRPVRRRFFLPLGSDGVEGACFEFDGDVDAAVCLPD